MWREVTYLARSSWKSKQLLALFPVFSWFLIFSPVVLQLPSNVPSFSFSFLTPKLTIKNDIGAQAGCMRQVLRPVALGRPRGIGWRGRWEGGSGWGILVNLWLIHVNVWQKPLQYCKVISLQLIKINEKKKRMILGPHNVWVLSVLVIFFFSIFSPLGISLSPMAVNRSC